MTTDDDLAAWGEPPAGPGEEDLARRCDSLLERLARGQSGPDDFPLARVVLWMNDCGVSLRESLVPDPHPPTILPGDGPMNADDTPPWTPGGPTVADPFPGE